MELIEILNKFDKSKIKAGDGRKDGIYPLYTCSPKVNKYLDNYLYDTEAIILSTGGNPVINYHKGRFSYSSDCLVVKSNGKFENKYIYYYLISKINEIGKMFRGAGLKHLNKKEFFKMNIELINIEEQKKIIKELDLINKLMDYKRKQIKLFDDFIKSQFVEMFGNIHFNVRKWNKNKWRDVLIIKNGKNQKKVESFNGKYPIYGSGGIIGFANDYICNENSIIIGRKGSINKPILVKTKFWNVDTAFGLEPIKEKIKADYLYYFCCFYNFEKHNKAVTIPSLTKKDLLNIEISVPPITLQNQFSEIVKQIDKQKFEIEKSLKETQELYESLMEKYFG